MTLPLAFRLLPLLALFLAPCRGYAQWSADSVLNTLVRDSAARQETTPLAAPGPQGSTYVAWFEAAPATSYQLRMQRLDSAGRPLWPRPGLVVSSFPQGSALFRYDLKTDLNGDALVAFQDERSGSLQPVIYKVAADGTLPWGAGIALTDSLATSGLAPVIGITHANNVVVAWNASGTGPGWIAARKFSPAGTPLWSTPFRVRDPAGTIGYTRPSWLPAGPDETLLFYIEQTGRFPFTSHVFAQRLSPAAQPQWTAPLNISTSLPFTFFPTPVPDGQGGAYLVYNAGNPANLTLTTVFAQHLLPAGSTAWGPDGVELLTGTSSVRFAAEAAPAVPSAAGELTVILTEQNVSQSTAGLTLQRLDAAGNRLFGPSGRVLLTPSSDLTRAAGLRGAGAGKSIVVFTTGGGLTQAISALGLDAAGNPAWTATPTRLISAAISGKDDLSLLPVRDGQLVVVWADDRRGGGPGTNGIYAQSIDMSGRLGGSVPTAAPLMADALPLPVIWPNPASEASLHLPTATPLPVILSLHDATGRLTYQRSHELSPDRSALRLPAELPAGLYHITLSVPSRQYHLRWLKL